MRLIDADALKEKLPPVFIEASCRDCPVVRGFVGLGNLINDAPTVDAVPVVRCGECKNYDVETTWCKIHSCFINRNGDFCMIVANAHYCSYGERREDNEKTAT